MKPLHLLTLLPFLSLSALQAGGQTIISENMTVYGRFLDFNLSSGAGSEEPDFSSSWDHDSGFGNPGSALVVTWNYESIEPSTPSSGFGETAFLYRHTTQWNPSTQGTLTALNFSLDYKTSDAAFDSLRFYVTNPTDGKFSFGSVPISADGQWHTFSLSNLSASDFQPVNNLIDFAGSASLRFGFGVFGSHPNGFGSGDPSSNTILFDNFQVVAVPEPSTTALLMVAGLAGLGLRMRRSRI